MHFVISSISYNRLSSSCWRCSSSSSSCSSFSSCSTLFFNCTSFRKRFWVAIELDSTSDSRHWERSRITEPYATVRAGPTTLRHTKLFSSTA
uniref:Uncharacterized protein n=1 Tax=Anopheles christyi TaxID=43041 RepID=A0A182KHQ7_9DIPT